MHWPTVEALTVSVPLPDGYRSLPDKTDVPALIKAIDAWFPGLAVGNASCYLREDFYLNRVFFDETHDLDFLSDFVQTRRRAGWHALGRARQG